MSRKNITSSRQYLLVGFEYGANLQDGVYALKLDDLFDLGSNPTEVDITLSEQIEIILDLKVGETSFVSLIRDHKDSKGVILRIN